MKLEVFGRESCAPCRMLQTYLDRKQIPFTKRDVDKDEEAAAEAYAYTGLSTVPVSVITRDDGSQDIVAGFNLQRLVALL